MKARARCLLAAVTLAGCGRDAEAPRASDAGTPAGLLLWDAGGFECPDASASRDSGRSDAARCVPGRVVSYAKDVVPIFGGHCNGESCHNATWGGSGAALHLVGVPSHECCGRRLLVSPGRVDESYLVDKLRGTNLCGGRQMPLGRHLDPADVATLSDWVCEGAPE